MKSVATCIKTNTENKGHMRSATSTHSEAVDRSSNASETVIPPLLLVRCHLGKGRERRRERCYRAKCLGVSSMPEDIK